ncbi:MAG TPA: hypothetical protein VES89_07875 [Candidatus Competibacteraceae bacterium]|nr:hypothetical protein [Candidatus Competibacteraceae bacterium]
MNRNAIAWLVPPAAVTRYGCATCTAGPIGVFWLASIVSIIYGLMGGTLGGWEGSQAFLVGLGIVMWFIAAVWARLVIHGVDEDLSENRQGSLHRRVIPRLDEADPFEEIS